MIMLNFSPAESWSFSNYKRFLFFFQELKLDGIVPRVRCRLVNYDRFLDTIECSFDDKLEDPIGEIIESLRSNYKHDMLLEIRPEHEPFRIYLPGGVLTKVYIVDLKTEDIEGPHNVRGNLEQTVGEFKQLLATELNLDINAGLQIVLEKYSNEPRLLTDDSKTLKSECFYSSSKVNKYSI